MPAFEPELMTPYRVLLGRSPVGMGPNRRPLPLYVTLYTLTMTTFPLTSYVMPDWSVTALDSESWDTESRSDVKHGRVADRASPRVLVEVHPCAGECAISVKRCSHQAERPIVIGVRLYDSDGRVSFDIFERPVVFKHIARSYICIWASVFHSFEQRSGYGITKRKLRPSRSRCNRGRRGRCCLRNSLWE